MQDARPTLTFPGHFPYLSLLPPTFSPFYLPCLFSSFSPPLSSFPFPLASFPFTSPALPFSFPRRDGVRIMYSHGAGWQRRFADTCVFFLVFVYLFLLREQEARCIPRWRDVRCVNNLHTFITQTMTRVASKLAPSLPVYSRIGRVPNATLLVFLRRIRDHVTLRWGVEARCR